MAGGSPCHMKNQNNVKIKVAYTIHFENHTNVKFKVAYIKHLDVMGMV